MNVKQAVAVIGTGLVLAGLGAMQATAETPARTVDVKQVSWDHGVPYLPLGNAPRK